MTSIHPSALIEEGAVISDDVEIGPFCVVGAGCVLERGVKLESHVVLAGHTMLGERVRVFPFASLGHQPQDLKFKGEESRLEIGADTVVREHVTMNPGTEGGGRLTKVGSNCLIMSAAHVAHDCLVGNHVILVNNATLGGHVVVGDHAILGGLSAVHQKVRIGPHAFIGGLTGVGHDVIPFGSVVGDRGRLAGLNLVGLRRRGFDRGAIQELSAAYTEIFDPNDNKTLIERVERTASAYKESQLVQDMVQFIMATGGRQILTPWAWKDAN